MYLREPDGRIGDPFSTMESILEWFSEAQNATQGVVLF